MKRINKKIIISGREVDCLIKTGRQYKNLSLRVDAGGKLNISRPRFLSDFYLNKYLFEKSGWIFSKIDYFKSLSLPSLEERKKVI